MISGSGMRILHVEKNSRLWNAERQKADIHAAAAVCHKTNKQLLDYIVGSRPSDHYFRSVCWFVCLLVCAVFLSRLWSDFDQTIGHMLYVWV